MPQSSILEGIQMNDVFRLEEQRSRSSTGGANLGQLCPKVRTKNLHIANGHVVMTVCSSNVWVVCTNQQPVDCHSFELTAILWPSAPIIVRYNTRNICSNACRGHCDFSVRLQRVEHFGERGRVKCPFDWWKIISVVNLPAHEVNDATFARIMSSSLALYLGLTTTTVFRRFANTLCVRVIWPCEYSSLILS